MTPRHHQLRRLQIAIVALLALLATACGSNVSEVSADRAGTVPAPQPLPAGAPEYGASLDEFAEAVHESEPTLPGSDDEATTATNSAFTTIEWPDLIPEGASGQDIVEQFQERLAQVEDGSPEATALYEEMQAAFNPEAVNTDLDGQEIRLAGFVAPLTYEGELVTEFLLVPNFGACIHVPPPPPNQTILVTIDEGLTPEEAWGAVWVEGTLEVSSADTHLAAASYAINRGTSGAYTDF